MEQDNDESNTDLPSWKKVPKLNRSTLTVDQLRKLKEKKRESSTEPDI